MPTYEPDELFARWLEGHLSREAREQFEHLCQDSEAFAARVAFSRRMEVMVSETPKQRVPRWNRETAYSSKDSTNAYPWLSLMSLATSVAAFLLVLFQLDIDLREGSLVLSFADSEQAQRIEMLIEQKLDQAEQSRQLALRQYVQYLQQRQLEYDRQFATYLLDANRVARKQDMAELIQYVDDQRRYDQQYYAQQLFRLRREEYQNAGNSGYLKSVGKPAPFER